MSPLSLEKGFLKKATGAMGILEGPFPLEGWAWQGGVFL